jgi:hypothetical protein
MDIEFSEVTGANAYEIEIIDRNLTKVRLEVNAPAHHAEWYAWPGIFRVKVRTINCGGLGKWSVEFVHSIGDNTPPPPSPPPGPQCVSNSCEEPPVPEPQCMFRCEPPPPPTCIENCDDEYDAE